MSVCRLKKKRESTTERMDSVLRNFLVFSRSQIATFIIFIYSNDQFLDNMKQSTGPKLGWKRLISATVTQGHSKKLMLVIRAHMLMLQPRWRNPAVWGLHKFPTTNSLSFQKRLGQTWESSVIPLEFLSNNSSILTKGINVKMIKERTCLMSGREQVVMLLRWGPYRKHWRRQKWMICWI